jgi:hypothetical protein
MPATSISMLYLLVRYLVRSRLSALIPFLGKTSSWGLTFPTGYAESVQAIADLGGSDDIKLLGFYGNPDGAVDIGDITNSIPAYFGAPSDPNYNARRMNPGFLSIQGDQGIAERRQALKVDALLGTNVQGTGSY